MQVLSRDTLYAALQFLKVTFLEHLLPGNITLQKQGTDVGNLSGWGKKKKFILVSTGYTTGYVLQEMLGHNVEIHNSKNYYGSQIME